MDYARRLLRAMPRRCFARLRARMVFDVSRYYSTPLFCKRDDA